MEQFTKPDDMADTLKKVLTEYGVDMKKTMESIGLNYFQNLMEKKIFWTMHSYRMILRK